MRLLNSSSFLVGFVLLNLQFSVWCFVDRLSVHLSFCPFSFGHCVIWSFFFWSLCYLVLLLLVIVLSDLLLLVIVLSDLLLLVIVLSDPKDV